MFWIKKNLINYFISIDKFSALRVIFLKRKIVHIQVLRINDFLFNTFKYFNIGNRFLIYGIKMLL